MGLGIMPSRVEFPYEPGAIHNLTLKIVNNDGRPMDIIFVTRGELANYVSYPNLTTHLENKQQIDLPITFTIPDGLKPGLHEALIGPLQLPPAGGRGISAVVSVLTQLRVRVPYPGKYAEVELETHDVNLAETEHFKVLLHSYGNETINLAEGKVVVFNDYNLVGEAQLESVQNIAPGSTVEMYGDWKPEEAGIYRAKAIVDYDGFSAVSENRSFKVGEMVMEIKKVEPQTLISGEINTLIVDVQSKWNAPLTAYATIQLLKSANGGVLAEGGTKTETFQPWETKSLSAYLNLKDVPTGIYPGVVTLYYEGKTTNMSTEFNVVAPKEQIVSITGVYYLLLLILIIIFLLIIYFRRREKKEENKWTRRY
ncbi:MAG: hypothetical protein QW063_02660 [Candidatus Nanoarchaeia archaeon]